MADTEHVGLLESGRGSWNDWRKAHPDVRPDLSGYQVVDDRINMRFLDLRNADLAGFKGWRTHFGRTDFSGSDLTGADFYASWLQDVRFREAVVRGANFASALLRDADFRGADLTDSNLVEARLVGVDFRGARLDGSRVYGASVWDVQLERASQRNLQIARGRDRITVDSLEMAQLVHLLASNSGLRDLLQTVVSKVVLILGSFAPERLPVLEAVKAQLRERYDYLPVLFTFEPPQDMDLVRSVVTLAHLSRFVIADITEPKAVPQELQAIVQSSTLPIRPIMQSGTAPPGGVFRSFLLSTERILKVYRYQDVDDLAERFDDVVAPVEAAVRSERKKDVELFE